MDRRVITVSVVTAALSVGLLSAHAGPCSDEIAQFEQAVRQSAGDPNAGPFARQTIRAQLDRQPTPKSIERAQKRARATFEAALARAKNSMLKAIELDAPRHSSLPGACITWTDECGVCGSSSSRARRKTHQSITAAIRSGVWIIPVRPAFIMIAPRTDGPIAAWPTTATPAAVGPDIAGVEEAGGTGRKIAFIVTVGLHQEFERGDTLLYLRSGWRRLQLACIQADRDRGDQHINDRTHSQRAPRRAFRMNARRFFGRLEVAELLIAPDVTRMAKARATNPPFAAWRRRNPTIRGNSGFTRALRNAIVET